MKKHLVIIGAIAALAVPSAALANSEATGVSSNGNTNDVIGYAISAGNYNLKHGNHPSFTNRGEWTRDLNAAGPGAMADAIHGVQAKEDTFEAAYGSYAPPSKQ